ncbi:MAG TPA: ATP-binding protein [Thermoprotei archaeon]|nr:ATP-binding protein [Thermoprotei archaeon]
MPLNIEVINTKQFKYILASVMRDTFKIEKLCFPYDRPKVLFVLGAPGIGKTAIIEDVTREVAESMGKKFIKYDDMLFEEIILNRDDYIVLIEIRLTESTPEDFIGFPEKYGIRETPDKWLDELKTKVMSMARTPEEKRKAEERLEKIKNILTHLDEVVKYAPLGWVITLATGPGVLFVDELTNETRPEIKSIAYKLLEGKVGHVSFSPQVLIVTAGNPPAERKSLAKELPAPLQNRTIAYYLEPDLDDWIEWAQNNEVPEYIISFLRANPALFYEEVLWYTLEPFPSPRSWTNLGYTLKSMGIEDTNTLRYVLRCIRSISKEEFEVSHEGSCVIPLSSVRDAPPTLARYFSDRVTLSDISKVVVATIVGAVGREAGTAFVTFFLRKGPVDAIMSGEWRVALELTTDLEKFKNTILDDAITTRIARIVLEMVRSNVMEITAIGTISADDINFLMTFTAYLSEGLEKFSTDLGVIHTLAENFATAVVRHIRKEVKDVPYALLTLASLILSFASKIYEDREVPSRISVFVQRISELSKGLERL